MPTAGTMNSKELCDRIRNFAETQLEYDLVRRDSNSEFVRSNWDKCASEGVLGLFIPQSYGGGGHNLLTTTKVLEALGYGCPDNGLTLAINGQMWAVQEPILQFGTEEQKQRFLPGLVNGSLLGAHGMTEEQSGSNAFDLSTTAEAVEGGYRLNGKKIYIGLGPVCDLILVFAATQPDRGRWGLSTFIVDANSDGIACTPAQQKMGLRTAPLGEITMNEVFVPADRLLGKEGSGASIFNSSMEYERSFIFASHVGSMQRQLDETIRFAKQRILGEQPISKLQTIGNRIADMAVRVETARMFIQRAAMSLDAGNRVPLEAAMAKLIVSEAFVENSLAAIRIHGGKGYLSEHGVDRDLRDALGGVIYSGTSDIQRNLIAGLLGL